MDALDNNIGEGGVVAIVPALKRMQHLENLNLSCELSMYYIACSLVYAGRIKGMHVGLLREV